jgi:hypothetical protein
LIASPWHVEPGRALLDWRGIRAELDLSRPSEGLQLKQALGHETLGKELLGVSFERSAQDASDCDAYARGLDLIATYAEAPERPFRVQTYWRCVEFPVESTPEALAVDLEVSVQTPLLDCLPQVSTRSAVRSSAMIETTQVTAPETGGVDNNASALSHGGLVLSVAADDDGNAWQYAEMIHAEDSRSGSAEMLDGSWRLEHELFEPGLEKGVIRRVRVRGLIYPGAFDRALVEIAYRHFHGSSLPLTV